MLAWWIELLPLFIVRRLARRHCERIVLRNAIVYDARPGVFILEDHAR